MGSLLQKVILCFPLLLAGFISKGQHVSATELTIDCNAPTKPFANFWNATGYSPAEWNLRPDMKQTLSYLGAIPNKGMVFIRPHYLLNLVGTEGLGTANPKYNWELLDVALEVYRRNNLKPFFELMGNPARTLQVPTYKYDVNFQKQLDNPLSFFSDFNKKEQIYAWKRLVKDLALHLIDKFGKEEVESWYFETTNEPNIPKFWPHGDVAFNHYYDACSEGLKEANPKLRFGGPGTANKDVIPTFKSLMLHCDTGTNYFTGERGVRIDFISIHQKEMPHTMVDQELNYHNYLKKSHPRFAKVPFVNNEADPAGSWQRNYLWHAKAWYAGFVVQSMDAHLTRMIDSAGVNYGLLSNDNGFIGTWGYRTQYTRFMKDSACFSLIKKPVVNAMSILSLLGKRRMELGNLFPNKNVGVIATADAGQLSILAYNVPKVNMADKNPSLDSLKEADKLIQTITFNFKNTSLKKPLLVKYTLSDDKDNAYSKWLSLGSPAVPSTGQLIEMRNVQELSLDIDPVKVKPVNGSLQLKMEVKPATVTLYHLLNKPALAPDQVKDVRFENYCGVNGEREIMVIWKTLPSKTIKTYEVLYASANSDKFQRINKPDIIDGAFIHVPAVNSAGKYKIRAVDYWGRTGKKSKEILIK